MKQIKLNFGHELKSILLSLSSASSWAANLGVSRSALSQWFSEESKPKPENLVLIRSLLEQKNDKSAHKKFLKLCLMDSSFFDDNLIKFKTNNLNDYISRFEMKSLIKRIQNLTPMSDNTEYFYQNISSVIRFISLLSFPVFQKFIELINRFDSLYDPYSKKQYDREIGIRIHKMIKELDQETDMSIQNPKIKLSYIKRRNLYVSLKGEDLKSSEKGQKILNKNRNLLTAPSC